MASRSIRTQLLGIDIVRAIREAADEAFEMHGMRFPEPDALLADLERLEDEALEWTLTRMGRSLYDSKSYARATRDFDAAVVAACQGAAGPDARAMLAACLVYLEDKVLATMPAEPAGRRIAWEELTKAVFELLEWYRRQSGQNEAKEDQGVELGERLGLVI